MQAFIDRNPEGQNTDFTIAALESLRTGDPVDLAETPQTAAPHWRFFVSTEERLAWLDTQGRWGHVSFASFWADDARELRRDPRFIAFLDREGVLDVWRERGPPPDCRAEGDTFRCGLGGASAP